MIPIEQKLIQTLLDNIQQRFYTKKPKQLFYNDKKMLTYAITWPAGWMQNKQLHCTSKRYMHIIEQRLDDILKHGNPTHYQLYFPRYLLKCLQDYFYHNLDQLYYEFTHLGNVIKRIDSILSHPHTATQHKHIEVMARTHQRDIPESCGLS